MTAFHPSNQVVYSMFGRMLCFSMLDLGWQQMLPRDTSSQMNAVIVLCRAANNVLYVCRMHLALRLHHVCARSTGDPASSHRHYSYGLDPVMLNRAWGRGWRRGKEGNAFIWCHQMTHTVCVARCVRRTHCEVVTRRQSSWWWSL